jgi:hypothetical protein
MDLANVVYSTQVFPSKGNAWAETFGKLSESIQFSLENLEVSTRQTISISSDA